MAEKPKPQEPNPAENFTREELEAIAREEAERNLQNENLLAGSPLENLPPLEDGKKLEQWWLNARDVNKMLDLLETKNIKDFRKIRLFAVACCRNIENLKKQPLQSRESVDISEKFADGHATIEELNNVPAQPRVYSVSVSNYYNDIETAYDNVNDIARYCAMDVGLSQDSADAARLARDNERITQSKLLRDIFGPFAEKPIIEPSWLSWGDGAVKKIAQKIYDDRTFNDEMPILADALEDAGCANKEILGHCRGPGPHVRGCWVLDLLLQKDQGAPPQKK